MYNFRVTVLFFYLNVSIFILLVDQRESWASHPILDATSGGGGVLPKKLGWGVRPASQNPYPIYD